MIYDKYMNERVGLKKLKMGKMSLKVLTAVGFEPTPPRRLVP